MSGNLHKFKYTFPSSGQAFSLSILFFSVLPIIRREKFRTPLARYNSQVQRLVYVKRIQLARSGRQNPI